MTIRPRDMTQQELADLLKAEGFTACCKAAVSLAERPKDSGVQFTPEARKAAQRAVKQARGDIDARTGNPSPTENRKNGRKTTVWFDEETRGWLETRAYMEDTNVGEIIRRAVRLLRETAAMDRAYRDAMKKAASTVGAVEAAGERTR